MGTIKQVCERYKMAYEALPDAISNTVNRTQDVLLDLNRDQLLQGRDADGKVLMPPYMQDPYFKTREAALRYLRMKIALEASHKSLMRYFAGIQTYPEKSKGTPNLIVTGQFHGGFFITVTKSTYTIDSMYKDADDINMKYNGRVYGLAPKSKEFYYFGYIRPAIKEVYGK